MKKISWMHFLTLTTVSTLFFFVGLSNTSLWDNDEPTYAEIAKEMVKSGHWLTPMFNHQPWFCHPPLYMWLTAFAFKMFGWSEITARFFPCLFALLGVFVVYVFASHFWDQKTGLFSAIILATSLQYLVQGRMATMDTMLNTFLLLALYSGWRALTEKSPRWWIIFFIACGMATLAKGVFGLAYPIFIFAIYVFVGRRPFSWKEIPWLKGLPLYLIIAAPWFVYEAILYKHAFLYQVFYFYTFKRVVTPILRQSGPIYYYIPVLLFGFFPWSGFLPALGIKSWKWKNDPKILFVGVWALATFLFFTFVNTKLPNYIFFLYPPLAMLLAYFWLQLSRREIFLGHLLTLITLGLFAYGLRILILQKILEKELQAHIHEMNWLLGILAIGAVAALLVEWISKRRMLTFFTLAFSMGLFWLASLIRFAPVMEIYKPMKPLAHRLAIIAAGNPASVIAFHAPATASLIFYSDNPVINVDNPEEFLNLWKEKKVYAVLREKDFDAISDKMKPYWPLDHRQALWLLANFKPMVLK